MYVCVYVWMQMDASIYIYVCMNTWRHVRVCMYNTLSSWGNIQIWQYVCNVCMKVGRWVVTHTGMHDIMYVCLHVRMYIYMYSKTFFTHEPFKSNRFYTLSRPLLQKPNIYLPSFKSLLTNDDHANTNNDDSAAADIATEVAQLKTF